MTQLFTLPIKVGFVLLSNSRNPIPSTRIAVLNMFRYLPAAGFDPHVVFEPERSTDKPDVSGLGARLIREGFQIVVFQKVRGPSVEALIPELRAAGIRTIFCVCDFIDLTMAAATDATVVVSDFLKSLYPPALQAKIHVVHDGIEHPELFRATARNCRGTPANRLRAVLVTSATLESLPQIGTPPRWLHVTIVGRYFSPHQIKARLGQAARRLLKGPTARERMRSLGFMLDPNIRCVAWDPVGVYREILNADVGIIPIEMNDDYNIHAPVPSWKVKSENRLSMKMCAGLPVVATPIPSYVPLIEQGRNGFFASSRQEWLAHLDALRDPLARERIGQAARNTVLQAYSMKAQADLLAGVFRQVLASTTDIPARHLV